MAVMRFVVFSLTCFLSVSAIAAPKTLKEGSLVCTSEEAYDKQLQYIVQGVNKLVGGCGFTNKTYQVVVIDLNLLSASQVQIVENDIAVWTAHESLSN